MFFRRRPLPHGHGSVTEPRALASGLPYQGYVTVIPLSERMLGFCSWFLYQDSKGSFSALHRTIQRVALDWLASGFPDEPQKLSAS